jgi:hypothetical protein
MWASILGAFREGVLLASRHSGLPAILVASVAIVIAWRNAKRALHFAARDGLRLRRADFLCRHGVDPVLSSGSVRAP